VPSPLVAACARLRCCAAGRLKPLPCAKRDDRGGGGGQESRPPGDVPDRHMHDMPCVSPRVCTRKPGVLQESSVQESFHRNGGDAGGISRGRSVAGGASTVAGMSTGGPARHRSASRSRGHRRWQPLAAESIRGRSRIMRFRTGKRPHGCWPNGSALSRTESARARRPRGAVPMAKIVAEALQGDLDSCWSTSCGHFQPELDGSGR